jgi:GlcNAc-P-P-Und epimerase
MPTSFLLTGASGFLGRIICQQLSPQHTITTLGRKEENNVICDLATTIPIIPQPINVVIHAAGKAHSTPTTEGEKRDFFQVNLTGTQNLCKGLEAMPVRPQSFIFISTVAVYGKDEGEGITEQHPLEGSTPYARSKIAAEQYLQQWCMEKGIRLAILRLPLVAGPHPPGNLGAMIRGIQQGRYYNIGHGAAQKSMVLAQDVAAALPRIAETGGTYNLTDGYHPSFKELAALIAQQVGKPTPKNIPPGLARLLALVGDWLGSKAPINNDKLRKLTATLTFDDSMARRSFGWQPRPVLEAFHIS